MRPQPMAPGVPQKLRNITNNLDIHKRQGRPPHKVLDLSDFKSEQYM